MTNGNDDTSTTQKPDRFDSLADEVASNSREDRKRFLEMMDDMRKLMATNPEVAVIMCEQIVRAHDVLNKINGSLTSLALAVLKSKAKQGPEANDEMDDLYDGIGPLEHGH